ncbi:MAG: sulfatase, partial [Sphaerochaetaceae bacterium]
MKAILIFFDSLNKRFLQPYGATEAHPSFSALETRATVFDNCFAGSLPCMPARRELHTGRYNFLHRCWGPIEPFDDSMPQILKQHGIHTHLVSDHAHYWEDGGCTYHTRYSTWEGFRGQEGDAWKGSVDEPKIPEGALGRKKHSWRQEWVNRSHMKTIQDTSLHKTFFAGIEFIDSNHDQDNWFLQIEPFDPHEPYFLPPDPDFPGEEIDGNYDGLFFDWPDYRKSEDYSTQQIEHVRRLYKILVKRCDRYLGKVLAKMDQYNLWEDTMLIVSTDHGFLLGEHGWMGKNRMPLYHDISNLPLFVFDPRHKDMQSKRSDTLVQTIDIAPTILDFFNIEAPKDMLGRTYAHWEHASRDGLLFGLHGGHINVFDGRYVYMRAPVDPDDKNLFNYTLMPTHIYSLFTPEELQDMELVDPLSFTKDCKVLKIRALGPSHNTYQHKAGDFLFDLTTDPGQTKNLATKEPELKGRLLSLMTRLIQEHDGP